MTTLSNELLLAYVDGQLDKPQAAVVAQVIRNDEDVATRVSRLQQTQSQFLDTFGALIREGASAPARDGQTGRAGSGKPGSAYGKVLTAGLLVLIGAGLGLTAAYAAGLIKPPVQEVIQMPPSNWPGDIAEFHSFFTREGLIVSPESQSNPEMVEFQFSRQFSGRKLPILREQELEFMRGQLLTYRGNRVMQLIYAGKSGEPVALYIAAGGLDMTMTPGRFGNVKTVSWSRDEMRFVLAADMPHQALRALAVIAMSQLGES